MSDKRKTILVTGSNGQLGSELKSIKNEFQAFDFIFTDKDLLDISKEQDVKEFFASNTIDFCVNAAAYTAVDTAEKEEEKALKLNAHAVKYLAESCAKYQVKLIHISTDFVFEGDTKKALKEEDTTHPINVYGATKLKGEEWALKNKSLVIRTSWLYSRYGNNFVKTMLKLGQDREELNIISDQFGTPTYALDLAYVILELISKNEPKNLQGLYHFSNHGTASWYDFAVEIFKISNISCKANPIPTTEYPTPARRPKYSVMDKSKIQNDFGVRLKDWKESLSNCLLEKQSNLKENSNNRSGVDINRILEISKLAGLEILKIYKEDFDVYQKQDESPLTKADKNANDIIIKHLTDSYPEIPYISEELKNLEYDKRKLWEYCWIIDPLDGTKEFIKKNGEFTVNIALVRNGKPILGVVYIPVEDTFFYAEENKGTYKKIGDNPPKYLDKRKDISKQQKLKVVASRSHLSEEVVNYVKKLESTGKEVEFVSAGSSLKFCLVAEGKADIYPRLAPTMEWDTAAAQIICTELGIDVVDFKTNKTMVYNKENLLNPWFIVK